MIPGTSVAVAATLAAGDPLDDAHGVRVVVVRAEDHLEEDAHGGDQQRRQQRPAEVVDHEGVLQQIGGELEHDGVEDQDEHEAEREHVGETERREQRREHSVQHGDHGGHCERAAVPRDVDTGQDHRRNPQRQGGQRPRQQHAERLEPRPLRLPRDALAVQGGPRCSPSILALRRALRFLLLRLLLGPLGLLLGDFDLGVAVGLPDEQLPAAPAEDGDDEDQRDEDVPGCCDQLLGGGIGDGGAIGDVAARVECERVRRLGDPDRPRRERDGVRQRARAGHPHDRLEGDRDRECGQEDPDHGQLAQP